MNTGHTQGVWVGMKVWGAPPCTAVAPSPALSSRVRVLITPFQTSKRVGAMPRKQPKLCEREGCTKGARPGGTPHCKAHGGGRRCKDEDCTKSAFDRTGFCRGHGGGRRCQHVGCLKAASSGGTPHCKAHGGGKRCKEEDCTKSAIDDTGFCRGHGGGKRCQHVGCLKAAESSGTPHCKAHGGGKRCEEENCTKSAQGSTPHCTAHGGGKRCQKEDCFQLVARGPGNVYCGPCLQAM